MLVVLATNISSNPKNADYRVEVSANQKILWEGVVRNHIRSRGTATLLRQIAREMSKDPRTTGPRVVTP